VVDVIIDHGRRRSSDDPLRSIPGVEDVLGQGAVWADVPDDLEKRVLAAARRPSGQPRRLLGWPRRRMLLAAAGLVVLAGIGLLAVQGDDDGHLELTGTALAARAHAEVALSDTPSGAEFRLDVSGLPPAAPGTYYEGWLTGDRGWVSIGTFHLRRGAMDVVLWSGVEPADYPDIAVTVQREGGGAKSSGQVVLFGEIPPALR
jgi:Anti-sigma-K factor rskA